MKHRATQTISLEKLLQIALVDHKVGLGQGNRESPGWGKQCVRLMESQIWCPPASSVVLLGRVHKRNSGLYQHLLSGRKQCPSFLPDSGRLSSSLHILMPFNLLHPRWSSEGVILRKPCVGPLRGTARESGSFYHIQPQSLLLFTARSLGTSLPGTGTLGWWPWCRTGTPPS